MENDKKKKNITHDYLTRSKAQESIQTIVEKIKTERLPLDIKKVVIVGSSIKGKEKPHAINILLIYDESKYGFKQAEDVYYQLIGNSFGTHSDPKLVTKRLLTKGMKGIHMQFAPSLDSFINHLPSNRKNDDLLLEVIWVDRREEKSPILKQNPMKLMEKSNYYLTRSKAQESIQTIVEKIKTERLPVYNKIVVIFGSSIKDKEKLHDIDFLLIYDESKYGFKQAKYAFCRLIGISSGTYSPHSNPKVVTKRLLTKGMKGIHMQFATSLDSFINHLLSNRKNDDLLLEVILVDRREEKSPILKQNPMKPYVKYIEQTNDWNIEGLNIDTAKALEIGKLIKTTFLEKADEGFIRDFVDIYMKDGKKCIKKWLKEEPTITDEEKKSNKIT